MKKLFLFLVFISFGKAFAQSEAPSNLAAVAVSSKQVNLSWKDNSTRELGFEIERSTTSETAGFTKLGEVAANVVSYTDANPPANTYSYYRVRAKLTATTFSGYSNVVYAFPPVAPNISKIEVKGTNWIAITFKVQGGKENGNVVIQRRQGQGGAWSTIGSFDSNLTFYDDQTVPLDNTEYCYRVSWTGAPNEYSNIACATTLASPPNPPTNLSAVAVSSSQINLSWTDASNNESGFEVFRSTDNANFSKIADVGANVTTYANAGLNASTRYYYYVGSQRGGTPSRTKSNTADATTQSALPNAPARLTANATSSSQINLSWADLSDNETGFEIERSTDSRNYSKIADVGAGTTTYANTGLVSNTQYCYRVRAKNGAGNSGYTDPACATTQAPPVTIPRPPSGLTATATSSSQINLSWTDNASDETGFEIERSTDGINFAKIADVGANATTYSNTGLNASTRYWYRVRANNSAGASSYTNVADATTQAPPVTIPRPPSGLIATATSSSQINLGWADNASDETAFEIERSTDGTNFAKIADVGANATTYSNTGLNASTRYWYRVRANNSAGASSYTNVADATTQAPPVTIPRPPSGLIATATSSSQINLGWADNASDETAFEIERSTDGTNFAKIADVGANATTYSNTGLNASTRYWYRVRANNSAGSSSYTNVADATTQAPPVTIPRPPSGLIATATSSSQINLGWADNASDETAFEIERSTDGTNFAKIADVGANATTYSNTGLNASTRYWYRVRANNSAGSSSYTNVADATTQAPPVTIPRPPSGLTATATSSSQINLGWTDNASDETGFEIERSTDGTNFAKIAEVGANATTYSNTGLNASTRYWYRVRANNSAGASSYTNVSDATTQAPPVTIPRPPSGLTATATSSSQINLGWADNASDETGFEIERSTDGTNFAKIADVGANATTYSNTGLNASTRYWYRVRAKNSAGASSYTNVADATTLLAVPATPTNLTAELADYDQIRLTWGTLSNATNVLVERSTSPTTGFAQITQQPATSTSYVDLGLNEQTTYYYRIRLSNAAGNSGYSNVVSVTTPEVVISVRPQLSEVGLTLVAYGQTLRIQNERFQPLEIDWKIMSLNGQPLKTDAGIVAGKQAWIHDLSALRGGVYVVIVNAENHVFSTKIVLN